MRNLLERQRHILDFTIASLLRRKWKNGSLLAVYTLLVFLLSSILLFSHALKTEANAVLQGTPEIIVQRSLTGRYQPVPLSYAEKIAEIRGIHSVRPRLWGYYYDANFLANYTLLVPREGAPQPGFIDIGSGISRIRDTHPGDVIGFTGHDGKPRSFTIRKVLPAGSELVSADLILISESDYRDFSGLPADQATDLVITVRNPREFSTVAEKVVRLLPDSRPIVRDEILRTYDAVFGWRSGLVIVVFGAVALAFVIFAWDKATGLSAEERREIGILKAVGWETADVLHLKFWEGVVVSLTAFLAGYLLAYAHVFLGGSFLFAPVLKGWSVLYPEFRLVPSLDCGELAAIFFLTVVPYTATTIVPSWRAATIDPDAVMR
ncbi:FtsX-like permease family protein [Geomonas subterranea]|uniref:FtsX-like permease family protein n=1 Tax=Geomonas subterranea TaxID=2847989 RepID=A0ABX8LKZ3_9BACT|nr:FtsX-like permease family protein [Geomonas subterranea]QXE91375.1 FtsX-like permease family protein [Geomonas subterranea]QXM10538.1 FtsX-like permease family protein [Geomonas subterranea]